MPDDWLAATLQRTRDGCSGHQVGFPGFPPALRGLPVSLNIAPDSRRVTWGIARCLPEALTQSRPGFPLSDVLQLTAGHLTAAGIPSFDAALHKLAFFPPISRASLAVLNSPFFICSSVRSSSGFPSFLSPGSTLTTTYGLIPQIPHSTLLEPCIALGTEE